MAPRTPAAVARIAAAALATLLVAAGGATAQESGAMPSAARSPLSSVLGMHRYEYDEHVDLSLDGSAVIDVTGSISALVALRGAPLDADPEARFDRPGVRAFFEGPGVTVTQLSAFRRYGRRFAHVRVVVSDIQRLSQVAPLSWSRYGLDRTDREYRFVQDVGPPAGGSAGDPGPYQSPYQGWTGDELVAFRLHLPSKINFHNSPDEIERGNILVWEQALRDRLAGAPLHMEARMETQSILYRTLWLFVGTFLAAMAALGFIIWWVVRKGRSMVPA